MGQLGDVAVALGVAGGACLGVDGAVDRHRCQRLTGGEMPRPGLPVGKEPANVLPGGSGRVGGTSKPDAVGQRRGRSAVEQPVDLVGRQVHGALGGQTAWIVLEKGLAALGGRRPVPALASPADQHPPAAVGGHVTRELFRCDQRGGANPEETVCGGGEALLDAPAGRTRRLRRGAVAGLGGGCGRLRTGPCHHRADHARQHQCPDGGALRGGRPSPPAKGPDAAKGSVVGKSAKFHRYPPVF